MKKILSTMLVGALIAGVAFADISFDYTGSAILSDTTKSFTTATRNDCLSLELSNDVAGVVCDWDLSGNKMELDAFYAWMTFGLPVGNLQITSGKWNSRFVNRVNSYAGDLDGDYYESFKPGIQYGGDQVVDGSNLTDGNYSTVLAYTLPDALPGVLMFKAGIVRVGTGKDSATNLYYTPSDSTDLKFHSSFVYEVSYAQEDTVRLNLAIKNTAIDTTSYGFYVSPLMIANLDSMVGVTYLADGDDSAFGLDLRASYAVTEKTSLTGMVNYTTVTPDVGDGDSALWTMASVGYKAGENIRYVFTLNNTVNSFTAPIATDSVFAISPACEVQASEKCNVTVGFDMRWENVKPFCGTATVTLPIYVSFSL